MKFLLLLLLPLNVFADVLELSEEELNPEAEEILIKKPEKYLRNQSMIYDFNSDLGIKDQRRYTGTDKNRFSMAGHIYGNYEQPGDLLGGEAAYMRKSTSFSEIWYGVQLFRHNTIFSAITQNRTQGSNPNSDANLQRPNTSDATITGVGAGVGYRFRFLADALNRDDIFENVDVFVNAIQMNDSFIDETYQGYGLTTNYGIHKRSSTRFFYGGKFSYNIASVTRPAIGNESKSDRSLTLGWLSFAFELGFYY